MRIMDQLAHLSYIFIPFTFERREDFPRLISALDNGGVWIQEDDEIKYMLKFVADKIDSRSRKTCRCFHYSLRDSARSGFGLPSEDLCVCARPTDRKEQEAFGLRLLDIHLYCFSTTVSVLAFKIHLTDSSPMQTASALYFLKKVSRVELVFPQGGAHSLLELAKTLTETLSAVSRLSFFYYANPSTERANTLTYLEVEQKEDYSRELFYLRNNYHSRFPFNESREMDSEGVFSTTSAVWGISQEAAVCLFVQTQEHERSLHERFFKNFNVQYLFMYVLLLHQKYVLYMFLSRPDVWKSGDMELLETYRQELYEFEASFVFSCITEVPQYQYLYSRTMQAFSLKKMYEDVHEPLLSLSEVRQKNSENNQQKRDRLLNKAVLALSLLSLFSALVDSYDFIGSFFRNLLSRSRIITLQCLCIALILGVFCYVLWAFFKSEGRKNK